jgi:peptidyl-prolyl cis-trans isomerase-like protein 2
VFGRVAKGMETLARMEDVPTDKKDKPLETIKIIDAQVFQNPVAEAEEKEKLRIQKQVEKRRKEKEERQATALGKSRGVSVTSKTSSTGSSSQNHSTLKVGRYLPKSKSGSKKKSESQTEGAILNDSKTIGTSRLPPPPKKTTYGDFSGW